MLRSTLSRWLFVFSLFGCCHVWASPQAGGYVVPEAERNAIQAVIRAQIEAFRADNAARAFSYATLGVQKQFGSARHFMDVVRKVYPPVYRPASVHFLLLDSIGTTPVQHVQLSDHDGKVWDAYYLMQRQKNGGWRIDGCQLTSALSNRLAT